MILNNSYGNLTLNGEDSIQFIFIQIVSTTITILTILIGLPLNFLSVFIIIRSINLWKITNGRFFINVKLYFIWIYSY